MMKKILLGVLVVLLPFFVIADHDLTDDVFEEAKYEESPLAQYTKNPQTRIITWLCIVWVKFI